jgi:glycosyltransferase involved in cell wall biosynthesis
VRILLVTREYPPDTAWGGIATLYHGLAQALAGKGHEVHVVCQAVDEQGDLADGEVLVHRVGTNPRRYSALARANYSLHAWRKARRIVDARNVDVVEAPHWGAEGLLYSLSRRTPLVVRVDISAADIVGTKTYSGKRQWLALQALSRLETFCARRADRIVAITHDLDDPLISRLHIDADRVDVVRHAIDTERFQPVESGMRPMLGIPDEAKVALFVGRLEARKGVHVLGEAVPRIVSRVPSTVFLLVGRDTDTSPAGGSMRAYVDRRAEEGDFQDRLVFVDSLTQDQLVKLYSMADVVVSPSLQESFGLVVVEAMACGRPVVATSTGIVPELGLDGTGGIMVSPGDAGHLADAVVSMLSLDGDGRERASLANRGLVESEFSIDRWADDVVAVYERAIAGREG